MGRARASAGAEVGQRQLRVGEGLRHVLAELLMRGGVREPLLTEASLTVTEVRTSRDLRHATVFVTRLGGELGDDLLAALARAAPYLRGEAGRRLHLKYAPELVFRPDTSFAEAARIEALLEKERAQLAHPSPHPSEDDDGDPA
jgi:ribosome-binding factor A